MAKGSNQKLKLLYLMKILLEHTDEAHAITVPEMIGALSAYGVSAERKSIYDDLEALRIYGLDIQMRKDKTFRYFVANRQFELPELKLLVDAVQSSRFLTRRKSTELIKKLESLASRYEAQQLQRQVYVANRIKAMNESIYYNVDKVHAAIAENRKISYLYFDWGVDKQKHFRRGGRRYCVSPWALTWDDENYYMVGYDSEAGIIKHYRVDKMQDIRPTSLAREGADLFGQFDMAVYARSLFGMYGGEQQVVRLKMRNHLAGVAIDRFGRDIYLQPLDSEWFTVAASVTVSPTFFAWVFSFGENAAVTGPESVVAQLREFLAKISGNYC